MKAAEITSSNRSTLMARFNVDPDDTEQMPLENFLICDFGIDEHFEVITPDKLEESFTTGAPLKNGFFEIFRK